MTYIRKKILLFGLLSSLSTSSLIGCSGNKNADKDNYILESFSYDTIDQIKVVILEKNEIIKPHLIFKNDYLLTEYSKPKRLSYIDLENGVTLKEYSYDYEGKNEIEVVGESIDILEEIDFLDYLFESDKIKQTYDTNELIEIYKSKEPEILKYIDEKYKNTKKLENKNSK